MTDSEIIKALEDILKNFDGKVVDFMAISSAIDLINRQKAEIEALIAGQETLQKYIAEKNAEIEETQKHLEKILVEVREAKELYVKDVAKAKAEAIKECLDKVEQIDVSESDDYIVIWLQTPIITHFVEPYCCPDFELERGDNNES